MTYHAPGLTYPEAIALIAMLKGKGIDANISVGCVKLYPEPDQVSLAGVICRAFGTEAKPGGTPRHVPGLIQYPKQPD